MIVAVDNRASEISKDSGIPIIERDTAGEFDSYIVNETDFDILLPWDHIGAWKEQLRKKLA